MKGAAIWHEVECGPYAADLPLWEEMAESRAGPILDLGCGAGRVALHLARRGHSVVGVDNDPELIALAASRAAESGLDVEFQQADIREMELDLRFDLIIAPMQVVQLVGGTKGRRRMLARVAAHARPGAPAAFALVDVPESEADFQPGEQRASPPLPDVRQDDGWIYSSLPIDVRTEAGSIAVERLRQKVSPEGHMEEELSTIRLDRLTPQSLEAEAEAAGLRTASRRLISETDAHVGSTVVVLEAPNG